MYCWIVNIAFFLLFGNFSKLLKKLQPHSTLCVLIVVIINLSVIILERILSVPTHTKNPSYVTWGEAVHAFFEILFVLHTRL